MKNTPTPEQILAMQKFKLLANIAKKTVRSDQSKTGESGYPDLPAIAKGDTSESNTDIS